MESSKFCVQSVEMKISSKICTDEMKTSTICHNYQIYHKNRICMSSGWARFLCHLYELFTLFLWTIYAICIEPLFMLCVPGGVFGSRTRPLTDARRGGLTWCTQAWSVDGHTGAVQPDHRGDRLGFLYYLEAQCLPSIYIYIYIYGRGNGSPRLPLVPRSPSQV
jgi:hypothetical protein